MTVAPTQPDGGECPNEGDDRPLLNDGERPTSEAGDRPDLATAAATLGISEADLSNVLGEPPLDFDTAAAALGVTVEALQEALGGQPPRG